MGYIKKARRINKSVHDSNYYKFRRKKMGKLRENAVSSRFDEDGFMENYPGRTALAVASDLNNAALDAHEVRHYLEDRFEHEDDIRNGVADNKLFILPQFEFDEEGDPIYTGYDWADPSPETEYGKTLKAVQQYVYDRVYDDLLREKGIEALETPEDNEEFMTRSINALNTYPTFFSPRDYLRWNLNNLGFDVGEADVLNYGDFEKNKAGGGLNRDIVKPIGRTIRNFLSPAFLPQTSDMMFGVDPVMRKRLPVTQFAADLAMDGAYNAIPGIGAAKIGSKVFPRAARAAAAGAGVGKTHILPLLEVGGGTGALQGLTSAAEKAVEHARFEPYADDRTIMVDGVDSPDAKYYDEGFTFKSPKFPRSWSDVGAEALGASIAGTLFSIPGVRSVNKVGRTLSAEATAAQAVRDAIATGQVQNKKYAREVWAYVTKEYPEYFLENMGHVPSEDEFFRRVWPSYIEYATKGPTEAEVQLPIDLGKQEFSIDAWDVPTTGRPTKFESEAYGQRLDDYRDKVGKIEDDADIKMRGEENIYENSKPKEPESKITPADDKPIEPRQMTGHQVVKEPEVTLPQIMSTQDMFEADFQPWNKNAIRAASGKVSGKIPKDKKGKGVATFEEAVGEDSGFDPSEVFTQVEVVPDKTGTRYPRRGAATVEETYTAPTDIRAHDMMKKAAETHEERMAKLAAKRDDDLMKATDDLRLFEENHPGVLGDSDMVHRYATSEDPKSVVSEFMDKNPGVFNEKQAEEFLKALGDPASLESKVFGHTKHFPGDGEGVGNYYLSRKAPEVRNPASFSYDEFVELRKKYPTLMKGTQAGKNPVLKKYETEFMPKEHAYEFMKKNSNIAPEYVDGQKAEWRWQKTTLPKADKPIKTEGTTRTKNVTLKLPTIPGMLPSVGETLIWKVGAPAAALGTRGKLNPGGEEDDWTE